jgi:hypothetical protein
MCLRGCEQVGICGISMCDDGGRACCRRDLHCLPASDICDLFVGRIIDLTWLTVLKMSHVGCALLFQLGHA